jgi:dUTP pyrophosphatase
MRLIPTTGTAPTYAHEGDAGADLVAIEEVWITPGAFRTIKTGTSVAIPEGHFGLVAGRSGLGIRYGIALVKGVGVLDAGYRGEIAVGLVNHGDNPFRICEGDRIAQLIIVPFVHGLFAHLGTLPESARGTGGLGSTKGFTDAA